MSDIRIGVTADTNNAVKGLSDVDKALLKLLETEKQNAANKEAKAKFDAMSDAEKKFALTTLQVERDLGKLEESLRKTAAASEETGEGFSDAGVKAIELNQAIELGKKVVEALGKAYEQVIGTTLELGEATETTMMLTGSTAEEASTLNAVLGDLGINQDMLARALEAGVRKGYEPTIEGLQKMRAEYQALPDSISQSAYLMETFGKSGMVMKEYLEADNEQLQKLAEHAKTVGLVMGLEGVESAKQYSIQVQELGDAWKGLMNTLGQKAVPVLTAVVTGVNDAITAGQKLKQQTEEVERQNFKTSDSFEEYAEKMLASVVGTEKFIDELGTLHYTTTDANGVTQELTQSEYALSAGMFKVRKEMEADPHIYDDHVAGMKDMERAAGSVDTKIKNLADDLRTNLSGAMTIFASNKSYRDAMAENDAKARGFKDTIAALMQLPYLTEEQKKQMADAQKGLSEVGLAEEALKKKQEEATKSMVFNMLLQKAASDGLTQTEFNNLLKIGTAWGILDQEAATTAQNLNNIDLSQADAELSGLNGIISAIMSQPNSKTITVTTIYNSSGGPGAPNPGPAGPANTGEHNHAEGDDAGGGYVWHWNGSSWVRVNKTGGHGEYSMTSAMTAPTSEGPRAPAVTAPTPAGNTVNINIYGIDEIQTQKLITRVKRELAGMRGSL